MSSKKIFRLPSFLVWFILLTFVVLPSVPRSAYATTPTPTTHQQLVQAFQQTRLESLRKRSLGQIDSRLKSLNKEIARLDKLSHLSASQKSAFLADINLNITDLNNLKTKISADTDLDTLQSDNKSIYATYRIFAVFEPRLNILAQGDNKLGRIADLEAKTTKQPALDKFAEAKVQINLAISTVTPLTPAGYPGNLPLLKTARTQLRTAETLIQQARQLM